jgi:hypothetical protein
MDARHHPTNADGVQSSGIFNGRTIALFDGAAKQNVPKFCAV